MAFWTIDLLSLDGTSTAYAAVPFRRATVTWAADGTGALEVELSKAQAAGGDWTPGLQRIAVNDGTATRCYQGWLDRFERSGAPGQEQYRAASRGLASILSRRFVHGDFSETATVATTIAQALLTHIAGQTYDKTGFTLGSVTGVAASRDRYYCDGDEILAAIDELAQTQDGGFAWEIDELGKFNAWVGGRGTDLSGSVTLAPASVQDWSCISDVSELTTYCTGLGNANNVQQPCGPPLVIDYTADRSTYGRIETVITSNSNDETEIEGQTSEELRARIASRLSLTTSWIEGKGPWAFGAVWIGDIVKAELGAEFGGDADVRCIGIQVALESTREFVTMTWEAA